MTGLIIIIIFPFIYFYTQMNNLNQKTDAIKKAVVEGKETYIDPIDLKIHWTKNGAIVTETKLSPFWKKKKKKGLPGDEVIIDPNTQEIYKNYSEEKYLLHIQNQIRQGKCWCGERIEFRDKGYMQDHNMKFHMKEKYYYRLSIIKTREPIYNEKGRYMFKNKLTVYCYKEIYDFKTKRYINKQEIGYTQYKKLGGEYNAQDFIIRHME